MSCAGCHGLFSEDGGHLKVKALPRNNPEASSPLLHQKRPREVQQWQSSPGTSLVGWPWSGKHQRNPPGLWLCPFEGAPTQRAQKVEWISSFIEHPKKCCALLEGVLSRFNQ